MKHKIFCRLMTIILLAISFEGKSQSPLVTWDFTGQGSCSNSSPGYGTISGTGTTSVSPGPFSLTSDLSCYSSSDQYSASGWTNASVVNTGSYFQVTITANPGFKLNITNIIFKVSRFSNGPSTIRIANNSTGDFTPNYTELSLPSTSSTSLTWTTSLTTAVGGSVTFRIYGYNATSTSPTTNVFKLWNFNIYGTVTTYNATTSQLGLVQIGNAAPTTGNISGLSISSSGVLTAAQATTTTMGAVQVGSNIPSSDTGSGSGLYVSGGVLATAPATYSNLGSVKVGSTSSNSGLGSGLSVNGGLLTATPATTSQLGVMKPGVNTSNPSNASGLNINNGILSSAPASTTNLGSVKVPSAGGLKVDSIGNLTLNSTNLDSNFIKTSGGTISGNFGIGIAPQAKLHTFGSLRLDKVDSLTADSVGDLYYRTANNGRLGRLSVGSDSTMVLSVKNGLPAWKKQVLPTFTDSSKWKIIGNNIYNKNTGNIGVGTTSPLSKLHVYDNNRDYLVEQKIMNTGGASVSSDTASVSTNNYLLLHQACTYNDVISSSDNNGNSIVTGGLSGHYILGKVTAVRGGTGMQNRLWTIEVNTSSAFNTNRGSLLKYNEDDGTNLVLVSYQGKIYMAVRIPTNTSLFNFSFTGYAYQQSLLIVKDNQLDVDSANDSGYPMAYSFPDLYTSSGSYDPSNLFAAADNDLDPQNVDNFVDFVSVPGGLHSGNLNVNGTTRIINTDADNSSYSLNLKSAQNTFHKGIYGVGIQAIKGTNTSAPLEIETSSLYLNSATGGSVGIGLDSFLNSGSPSTLGSILQIGKEQGVNKPSAVYIGNYGTATVNPAAQFAGNWPSPGRWGIGPSSNANTPGGFGWDNDKIIQLGRVDSNLTWLNDGQLALAIDGQLRVNGQGGPPPFGSSQIEFYFNQGSKIGYIESSTRGAAGATDTSYHETFNNLYLNQYLNVFGKTGVGIGTTNLHGYTLAVNGTIGTQKVTVTASNNWPDYVFKKSYNLPTLQSIEKFINLNKHLPGIPSASTVAKEGINLGDNQAVLLKKIEELTLYMIAQNKRIEKLEKELRSSKK